MKKCLLYVLSFAVLSIGLFLSFSDDAVAENFAFPTPPTICTQSEIPELMPQEYSDWLAEFTEDDDTRIMIFRTAHPVANPTGWRYWFYQIDGAFNIAPSNFAADVTGTNPHLAFRATTGFRSDTNVAYVNTDNDLLPTGAAHYPSEQTLGTNQLFRGTHPMNTTGGTGSRIDCIVKAKNINYTHAWDTETDEHRFVGGLVLEKPPEGCEPLAFGCWLTGLVDTIGGTIDGAITAVVKAITWLFTPDPDSFQASFDDLMDFFSDKLGFLFYPFELLERIYNSLVNADNGSSTMLGTYCLPSSSFFGSNFCIMTNRSGLLQAIRPLLQGLIALALIQGFRYKYKEVVHK